MRILEICVDLDGGGIDRYLQNYCSRISDIQFDFAIIKKSKEGILEAPLRALGCNIYQVPRQSLSLIENYNTLKKIMTSNHYDAVHCHLGAKSAVALLCAKKCGIKTRIVHAHIAFIPESAKEKVIRKIMTVAVKHYATALAACGVDAGKWLWGEKDYAVGKVSVHNNAIQTELFTFSEEVGTKVRKNLGISDGTFVVGHVGRISDQKNQTRLVDIFMEIHRIKPDSLLLIIGREDQDNEVQARVNKYGLDDYVLFLGVREDVPQLLNAMDVFIFPSKYEGLPFTLIETQCNGLPSLCSNVITPYVNVSKCLKSISLEESNQKWAEDAIYLAKNGHDPTAIEHVKNAGYDISIEAKKLRDYYFSQVH